MRNSPLAGRARALSVASFAVVVVGAVGGACVTAQAVDEDALTRIKSAPAGSYLSGAPLGLGEPLVVNRRDFIYAVDFDASSRALAFVHHVSTHMELTTTGIEPLAPVFQEKVNASEFDCEDVAIVDGRVLVPSRQGTLRAYDRQNGKLVTEVATGEALLRVAVNADGSVVAAGTAEGRVLLFDGKTLGFVGEGRVHKDEVRGLGFRGDRVVSASQDGTVVVARVAPVSEALVRVPTTKIASGDHVFLAHVDGVRAVATMRDARQPTTIISRDAVKRLDLPSRTDGSELTVMTAEGEKKLPAIDVGRLQVRLLDLGDLDAAVCDECLPVGVELLLGQDVLARVTAIDDVARDEIVLRPKDGDTSVALVAGARGVVVDKTISLPGPGNDLDSGPGGVVVTFSKDRAERTFDIHDAEKKGNFPPPSPQSGAAFVDVDAGVLGKQFVGGHLGFTVTGAVSPDGKTVVTGGWDRRLLMWDTTTGEVVTERSYAWLVRRARFAPDGHLLAVGAWTPVNALNEGDSDPSLLLYPVALQAPQVVPPQP